MIRNSIKYNGWILNILGLLLVFIYLSPIYWMVITSLKPQSEIFQAVPTLIPNDIQFNSYVDQFGTGLGQMTLNSFIIGISSMAIVVLVSVPAAYALARFNVKGAKLILLFFLITQMMPATVSLAPLFILFKNLGLLNTYLAPILATSTGGIAFSVLLLRPYFLSAPRALEEAALLDGCNKFTAFIRVMIPVVIPGVLVCASISFLFAWGDLISSLTFVRDQDLWPLTAGIYNAIGRYGTDYNYLMAFGTIAVIPVIVLFVSLQKYLVAGLAAGSVK